MPTLSSFCELCGRQVNESLKSVIIEGTVLRVCPRCSTRGKPYEPRTPKNIRNALPKGPTPSISSQITNQPRVNLRANPRSRIQLTDNTVLIHDFGRIIREARMKKGLSHEQLGLKMSEKASLLKKIETGALKPDELLAKKFERYLQVKLYQTIEDE